MHGPDGTDYPNRVVYREIVKPQRLVYDHDDDSPDPSIHFLATVTFEDLGGRTRVTLRARFESNEARDANIAKYHSLEGGKQHLGNLGAYLAELRGGTR